MAMRSDFIPGGLVAITPSDTTFVDLVGLIIGGAGNVAVVDAKGVTTTLAVIAGQQFHARIVQVKSTGTTATGIVGQTV